MAKTKNKKEDYPKVKYRLVDGNGYSLYNTWEEVEKQIHKMRYTEPYKNWENRFQPQYVIKVTEEYIEI